MKTLKSYFKMRELRIKSTDNIRFLIVFIYLILLLIYIYVMTLDFFRLSKKN